VPTGCCPRRGRSATGSNRYGLGKVYRACCTLQPSARADPARSCCSQAKATTEVLVFHRATPLVGIHFSCRLSTIRHCMPRLVPRPRTRRLSVRAPLGSTQNRRRRGRGLERSWHNQSDPARRRGDVGSKRVVARCGHGDPSRVHLPGTRGTWGADSSKVEMKARFLIRDPAIEAITLSRARKPPAALPQDGSIWRVVANFSRII
jgi:hypothetical protein